VIRGDLVLHLRRLLRADALEKIATAPRQRERDLHIVVARHRIAGRGQEVLDHADTLPWHHSQQENRE